MSRLEPAFIHRKTQTRFGGLSLVNASHSVDYGENVNSIRVRVDGPDLAKYQSLSCEPPNGDTLEIMVTTNSNRDGLSVYGVQGKLGGKEAVSIKADFNHKSPIVPQELLTRDLLQDMADHFTAPAEGPHPCLNEAVQKAYHEAKNVVSALVHEVKFTLEHYRTPQSQ